MALASRFQRFEVVSTGVLFVYFAFAIFAFFEFQSVALSSWTHFSLVRAGQKAVGGILGELESTAHAYGGFEMPTGVSTPEPLSFELLSLLSSAFTAPASVRVSFLASFSDDGSSAALAVLLRRVQSTDVLVYHNGECLLWNDLSDSEVLSVTSSSTPDSRVSCACPLTYSPSLADGMAYQSAERDSVPLNLTALGVGDALVVVTAGENRTGTGLGGVFVSGTATTRFFLDATLAEHVRAADRGTNDNFRQIQEGRQNSTAMYLTTAAGDVVSSARRPAGIIYDNRERPSCFPSASNQSVCVETRVTTGCKPFTQSQSAFYVAYHLDDEYECVDLGELYIGSGIDVDYRTKRPNSQIIESDDFWDPMTSIWVTQLKVEGSFEVLDRNMSIIEAGSTSEIPQKPLGASAIRFWTPTAESVTGACAASVVQSPTLGTSPFSVFVIAGKDSMVHATDFTNFGYLVLFSGISLLATFFVLQPLRYGSRRLSAATVKLGKIAHPEAFPHASGLIEDFGLEKGLADTSVPLAFDLGEKMPSSRTTTGRSRTNATSSLTASSVNLEERVEPSRPETPHSEMLGEATPQVSRLRLGDVVHADSDTSSVTLESETVESTVESEPSSVSFEVENALERLPVLTARLVPEVAHSVVRLLGHGVSRSMLDVTSDHFKTLLALATIAERDHLDTRCVTESKGVDKWSMDLLIDNARTLANKAVCGGSPMSSKDHMLSASSSIDTELHMYSDIYRRGLLTSTTREVLQSMKRHERADYASELSWYLRRTKLVDILDEKSQEVLFIETRREAERMARFDGDEPVEALCALVEAALVAEAIDPTSGSAPLPLALAKRLAEQSAALGGGTETLAATLQNDALRTRSKRPPKKSVAVRPVDELIRSLDTLWPTDREHNSLSMLSEGIDYTLPSPRRRSRRMSMSMRVSGNIRGEDSFEVSQRPSVRFRRAADMLLTEYLSRGPGLLEMDLVRDSVCRLALGLETFSRYVPACIVSNLLRVDGEAGLGSKQHNVVVFVLDLASFTTLVENLSVDTIHVILSALFERFCTHINQYRGYVDKFAGDAIIAVWNAPESVDYPHLRAVLAAMACLESLDELNARFKELDSEIPEIKIRIGIAAGAAVVGNVGYPKRFDFSVIGAPTDRAHQLEGYNKERFTQIAVDDEVFAKTRSHVLYRRLGVLRCGATDRIFSAFGPICPLAAAKPSHRAFADSFDLCLWLYEYVSIFSVSVVKEALLEHASRYPNDKTINVLLEHLERADVQALDV